MNDDIDEQIAAARPLLVQTVHALAPYLSLVDCAQLVNDILDRAADGNLNGVQAMLDALQRVLGESERARQIN